MKPACARERQPLSPWMTHTSDTNHATQRPLLPGQRVMAIADAEACCSSTMQATQTSHQHTLPASRNHLLQDCSDRAPLLFQDPGTTWQMQTCMRLADSETGSEMTGQPGQSWQLLKAEPGGRQPKPWEVETPPGVRDDGHDQRCHNTERQSALSQHSKTAD
jgi:hypothetical protein